MEGDEGVYNHNHSHSGRVRGLVSRQGTGLQFDGNDWAT